MPNKTYQRYLKKALRGDTQAYGDFYEALLPEIYRYIYYQVNHRETAEDLTESVFLKAWQALQANQKIPDNPRAWVYRIAHNLVIDHYRTRKSAENLDEARNLAEDAEKSPEAQYLRREKQSNLQILLQALEPRLRQVLVCRFLQGMSHAETAETLGLSTSHVRVLQHRALKQLRSLANKDLHL